jgi:hypothetical protein
MAIPQPAMAMVRLSLSLYCICWHFTACSGCHETQRVDASVCRTGEYSISLALDAALHWRTRSLPSGGARRPGGREGLQLGGCSPCHLLLRYDR